MMAEPELAARFRIGSVVTTVDAVNGPATLRTSSRARPSRRPLPTGCSSPRRTLLKAASASSPRLLAELSPAAKIIVDEDQREIGVSALPRQPGLTSWSARAVEALVALDRAAHHRRRYGEKLSIRTTSLATITWTCERSCSSPWHQSTASSSTRPVEWSAFAQWLDYIAALKGEDLRMKGIVNVAGEPMTAGMAAGVQHVLHPAGVRLEAWPSSDRRTRLVFIVRGVRSCERTLVKFAAVVRGSACTACAFGGMTMGRILSREENAVH